MGVIGDYLFRFRSLNFCGGARKMGTPPKKLSKPHPNLNTTGWGFT